MADHRVTVVIVTRDRAADLDRTLSALTQLPERPPVIVVDNGSSDGTGAVVARYGPPVTLIRLPRNRGAAGRNHGVRLAATPYVAFSDDDSWWAPGALAEAADLLDRHPRVGLVAGRAVIGPRERVDPISVLMARSPLEPVPGIPTPSVLGFMACASVVRREAFLAVGGFDELFGIGSEERLLAYDLAAAGWVLTYADQAVAKHHPAERDRATRRLIAERNDLWIDAMRRPPRVVAARVAALARAAVTDRQARWVLAHALLATPAVVRRRRTVPEAVEADIRRLEAADSRPVGGLRLVEEPQQRSVARRYVG
ncbi:MAG: glycosyltransferase family 2 protein [Catenulispora sp.]